MLHSRARHLLAYSRLCLRQRAVAFSFPSSLRLFVPVPFLFASTRQSNTSARFLSLSLSAPLSSVSVSLSFFSLSLRTSVSRFFSPYCLARARARMPIPIRPFPSLSRTHLIYRAVRYYDQRQFPSVRCWCARCLLHTVHRGHAVDTGYPLGKGKAEESEGRSRR